LSRMGNRRVSRAAGPGWRDFTLLPQGALDDCLVAGESEWFVRWACRDRLGQAWVLQPRCHIQTQSAEGNDASLVHRSLVVKSGDDASPYRLTLTFEHAAALRELVGEVGRHLTIASRQLGVKLSQRGDQIYVGGGADAVRVAADVLEQLFDVALAGHHLHGSDIDQACRMLKADPGTRLLELYSDTVAIGVGKKRIHPRSIRQRAYLNAIREHDLVFGIGPAGTGKTYLAMAMALAALFRNEVRRIVLARPAVEAGEKLGFLPGDLTEKVNPYLRPLYDALHDLAGFERADRLIQKGVIEVAPLAFMRGRTLADRCVNLDAAQNPTPAQRRLFLTRLGLGSHVVVTGDVTQIDLPERQKSGLVDVLEFMPEIEDVSICPFTDADVVRHPLVSAIVRAYAAADRRAEEREAQRKADARSLRDARRESGGRQW
ncbi:MAG: PhoH family protein, partial [Myxococcota bacterium]|nr:PhoH family protein [Myxococcota bacterium]